MVAYSPSIGCVANQYVKAVGRGQGNTAKNREQNIKTAVMIKQGMLQSLCLSFDHLLELGELSYLILKRRIRASCWLINFEFFSWIAVFRAYFLDTLGSWKYLQLYGLSHSHFLWQRGLSYKIWKRGSRAVIWSLEESDWITGRRTMSIIQVIVKRPSYISAV